MSDHGFIPIEGDAHGWHHDRQDGVTVLDETDRNEISALLIGRKVEKVDNEHIQLDDGTVIKAIGRDGGCACSAGCYDLTVLNGVDNIITNVEYDYRPGGDYGRPEMPGHPDDPEDEWNGYYRVFVYADAQKINLMQFNGSDGNGYYGTGFEILVRKGA